MFSIYDVSSERGDSLKKGGVTFFLPWPETYSLHIDIDSIRQQHPLFTCSYNIRCRTPIICCFTVHMNRLTMDEIGIKTVTSYPVKMIECKLDSLVC